MRSSNRRVAASALSALLVATALASPTAEATCLAPPGDVDTSGQATVTDVQCGILAVLWSLSGQGDAPACAQGDVLRADADCSGDVLVTDIQLLIAYVLGDGPAAAIDADGDGCPDTCGAGCLGNLPACDDGDACTIDTCEGSDCVHTFPDSPCDDGDVCTFDLCDPLTGCTNPTSAVITALADDFSDGSQGWELTPPWEIGAAQATTCGTSCTGQSPALDHTGTDDNGVAGVALGGCAPKVVQDFLCLTSPPFDASDANVVTLEFWRNAHTSYPSFNTSKIEAWDGNAWMAVWTQSGSACINDASWTALSYDLTPFAHDALQVRFCYKIGATNVFSQPHWMVDDVVVTVKRSLFCDDGVACTVDSCDPAVGCVHTPDDAACDDGVDCTIDSACDLAAGCAHTPDDAACATGSLCVVSETCDSLAGCVATPKSCDDGFACTVDSCDPSLGCVHTPDDAACDDGVACSIDTCDAFVGCVLTPGDAVCDDVEACTLAVCEITVASAASCAQLGFGNTTQYGSTKVCGESDASSLGGNCSGTVSFAEAKDFCEAAGARLCTMSELAANETRGTGCSYDDARVWSSTPCGEGAWVTGSGSTVYAADYPPECTLESAAGVVARCCADAAPASAGGKAGCVFTPTLCDDGIACTADICDPVQGCTHTPDDAQCDDGTDCLDVCDPGVGCTVAVGNCDDGDTCTADCDTGLPTCATASSTPGCSENAACEACVCGMDPFCCNNSWDGICAEEARNQCAAACDGECLYVAVDCSDGDPCTLDLCDAAAGCSNVPPEVSCDDGADCTVDSCVEGVGCENAPVDAECDDGVACTVDTCDVGVGCSNTPTDALCADDGEVCTAESCDPVAGCTTAPMDCDDGVDCALDACVAGVGCQHTADDAFCDDGVDCTVDKCTLASGCKNTATKSLCEDGDICTHDTCDPVQGCVVQVFDCDDGDACTLDTCYTPTVGACCKVVGALKGCPKDPPCQSCVCGKDPFCCNAIWDGQCNNVANGVCAGVCYCKPPPVECANDIVDCDDGFACTLDSCDSATGCDNAPDDALCDDGQACSSGDACDADLGCVYTLDDTPCDDGIACTTDACVGGVGCVQIPDDAQCDDGLPCTVDACATSAGCVHAPDDAACQDASACTDDLCDLALGCTHMPNAANCDDGSGCTVDICAVPVTSALTCAELGWGTGGASPWVCGESEILCDGCSTPQCSGALTQAAAQAFCAGAGARLCTIDELVAGESANSGCAYNDKRLWTSSPCQEGKVWTAAGNPGNLSGVPKQCTSVTTGNIFVRCCADVEPASVVAACGAVVDDCDDGFSCTLDSCDVATGCNHVPDDGVCDDGNACTSDVCTTTDGCVYEATGAACDDGNPCTEATCAQPFVSAASCGELGWNSTNYGSAAVCGESDWSPLGLKCGEDFTYNQANTHCTAVGARLCTAEEILAGETINTGCGFNATVVWTSTPCNGGHWATQGNGNASLICRPPTGTADVRCCADVDPGSIFGECLATGASADGCGDGDPCTNDVCNPTTGACSTELNTAPCNDGDPCTLTDTCDAGVCAGLPKDCSDNDPCTNDVCLPTGQCGHAVIFECYCGDGVCETFEEEQVPCPEDCGTGDGCGDGVCTITEDLGGTCPEDCGGGPGCGDGICSPLEQSGGFCAADCGGGGCTSPADCNDGDPTTLDSCSLATGKCIHLPAP